MKKILFAAAILTAGFISNVSAQSAQSSNDKIQGKAQVISAISVAAGNALQFGLVTQNVIKTIGNDGAVLRGTLGTSTTVGAEQVGSFGLFKGKNTQVTLAFTLPTYLSFGSEQLPISFGDYSGHKLARLFITGKTPVEFTPTSSFNITTALTDFFPAEEILVNIGGTVTPALSAVQGDYTGDITLTATYN